MSNVLRKGKLAGHFDKAARFHKAKAKAHEAAADAHDAMCEAHKGMASHLAKTMESMDLTKAEANGPGIEEMMKGTVGFHKASGAFHKAMSAHHGGLGRTHTSYSEHCFKMSGGKDEEDEEDEEEADDTDDTDDADDTSEEDAAAADEGEGDEDEEGAAKPAKKVAKAAGDGNEEENMQQEQFNKALADLTAATERIVALEEKIQKLEAVPEPMKVKGVGPSLIARDNKVVKAERVNMDDESGGLRAN